MARAAVRALAAIGLRESVREWFWSAPSAHGWHPPRAGEFYRTSDFDLEARGPDGEHYLLLHAPDDGVVWLWLKSHF